MNRHLTIAVAVLVVALVGVAPVLSAVPAHAALDGRPADGIRTAPPPGTGWHWGIKPSDLPACNWGSTDFDTRGGWSGRRIITETYDDQNPWSSAPTIPFRPMVVQWDEPCFDGSFSNASDRVRIPVMGYSLPVASTPSITPSRAWMYRKITVGSEEIKSAWLCSSSEWSSTYTEVPIVPNAGANQLFGSHVQAPPNSQTLSATSGTRDHSWFIRTTSTCTYLVGLRIAVCGYEEPASYPNYMVPRCNTFVWDAETWYRGQQYPDTPLDVELCRAGTYSLDCVYIDPPDQYTWDSVCGVGAPAYGTGPAQPVDWGVDWWNLGLSWVFTVWFPYIWEIWTDSIGHYAKCMFVPPGGWDSQGRIVAAWDSSGFARMGELIEDAASAFSISETCGVVMTLPPLLGGETVDTCGWASWAGPAKTFLTWTAWVAFGFWAITFITQTFLAAIRAVPMPNPLVMDVTEARAAEEIGR